jgi:uncharacterized RDD family membrane protein YckC
MARRTIAVIIDAFFHIVSGFVFAILAWPSFETVRENMFAGTTPPPETLLALSFEAGAIVLILWLALSFFLTVGQGRTFGQGFVDTEIVCYNGDSIGISAALTRTLSLPTSILLLPVNLLLILLGKQPLHDVVSRTAVIKSE